MDAASLQRLLKTCFSHLLAVPQFLPPDSEFSAEPFTPPDFLDKKNTESAEGNNILFFHFRITVTYWSWLFRQAMCYGGCFPAPARLDRDTRVPSFRAAVASGIWHWGDFYPVDHFLSFWNSISANLNRGEGFEESECFLGQGRGPVPDHISSLRGAESICVIKRESR